MLPKTPLILSFSPKDYRVQTSDSPKGKAEPRFQTVFLADDACGKSPNALPTDAVLANIALEYLAFSTCLNPAAPRGEGRDEGAFGNAERQVFSWTGYDTKV
jgi:hypothetical protein